MNKAMHGDTEHRGDKVHRFKAKIKNLAVKNHIPAQAVLQNFMLERLLERISTSKYKDMVILKGGMLIASLVGISSRTTMDMDATLRGYPLSEETIRLAFAEICAIQLEDSVCFELGHIAPIREDDEYGGYRVAIIARYESINTPLKIDITTGDIITPGAVRYTFTRILKTKLIVLNDRVGIFFDLTSFRFRIAGFAAQFGKS